MRLRVEEQIAGGAAAELAVVEQADDAVFAVVAGLADHLSGAQARDRLGEQGRRVARDVFHRHRFEDVELGAERRHQAVVAALDGLRLHAARRDLRNHFGERHQARYLARRLGRPHLVFTTIRQRFHAVQHADVVGSPHTRQRPPFACVSAGD